MHLEHLFNKFFFYPPEAEAPAKTGPVGTEDIIDILNTEDDKEDDKTPPKLSEESKEEEESEEEETLELEEEEPEKVDELITPPSRKEILKKYPNIFKEFPSLQSSFYRERQFTEVFSNPAEAQEAAEKAETLDKFEQTLLSGKTDDILKSVKNENADSFQKIVDDYIPALLRVDKEAGMAVCSNIITQTLNYQYHQGKASGDDDLVTAVGIINKAIFGTAQLQQIKQTQTQVNPEADKLKREREEFTRERFESAQNDVGTKLANSIKATISLNMDPKGVMTDYIKNVAVEKANEEVDRLIRQDASFVKLCDRLWEKAFSSNFSRDSLEKIISTYKTKAKALLPTVIQKSRTEALKGLGKKSEGDKKGPLPVGRSASSGKSSTKGPAEKKSMPKGMTTFDYLMQD